MRNFLTILALLLMGQSPIPSPTPWVPQQSAGFRFPTGPGPNLLVHSTAITTGDAVVSPWATQSNTGVSVTMATNAALAPDRTLRAHRFNFPAAVAGNNYALLWQPQTLSAGTYTASVYLQGVAGVSDSGTIVLMLEEASYTLCAFTSSAWSRCTYTTTVTTGLRYFYLGFDRSAGHAALPAVSVYVAFPQVDPGASATAYHEVM